MTLRILHIGNIANNSYNIVKALRKHSDIEADCFTNHYNHYISQPEWEDADIGVIPCDEYQPINWKNVDLKGFSRPDWYFETTNEAKLHAILLPYKDFLRSLTFVQSPEVSASIRKEFESILHASEKKDRNACKYLAQLATGYLPRDDGQVPTDSAWIHFLQQEFRRLLVSSHSSTMDEYDLTRHFNKDFRDILNRYDIIQTYGAYEPILPMLLAPSVPRITFEHGTMRDFPFQDNHLGRTTALAYKTAFKNIITNADSIHNAKTLGLNNYVFIPHPVDDTKFRPAPDPAFRSDLLRKHDATHIFLALARQNWELKGNDRVIRGFSAFIKRVGPGAKLFLGGWGQEITQSKDLIRQLHMDDHIAWLPPLPKRLLARYINAADIVLDQFILGAFGTTTPEAMACGKPVLLYYKREDHQWCLPQDPPVVNVHTSEEIAAALERLVENPEEARRIGESSLAWFHQFHSIDIVVERHLKIYQDLEMSSAMVVVPKKLYMRGNLMNKAEVSPFLTAVNAAWPARWSISRGICAILGKPGKKGLALYAARDKNGETSVNKAFVPIIAYTQPSATSEESPYLHPVIGKNALEILDDRLKALPSIRKIVMVMGNDEPAIESEARRLGWLVLNRKKGLRSIIKQFPIRIVWEILKADILMQCSLESPFLDKTLTEQWSLAMCRNANSVSISSIQENPYIPLQGMTIGVAIRAFLYRMIMRGTNLNLGLGEALREVSSHCVQVPAISLPKGTTKIYYQGSELYVSAMGKTDFSLVDLATLDKSALRSAMAKSMRGAKNPHLSNATLNAQEADDRVDNMESFPTFVGLNMTSVCNARCTFCSIQPKEQKFKDFITLEDIKKMDWLRYVSSMAIWGGIGDSLMNKAFLPCFRYLRETHPHLEITFSTNGALMNQELCEAFAGNLTRYNVSLNAARKETWEKMMRARGFDNTCETFATLARIRPDKNHPQMVLSMVITRENVAEVVEFAELAHKLGADMVAYTHYVPSTLVGRRDLSPDESLYRDQNESDQWLAKAEARAKELGLEVIRPLAFDILHTHISYGSRVLDKPSNCLDPWKTCYLTVDEDGRRQMIFCCSGFYYEIEYDKSDMNEENFKKIWNHPAARYFRRTVNIHGANPICTYCQSEDRFDPDNRSIYNIGEKIQPFFAELNNKFVNNELPDNEHMENAVKALLTPGRIGIGDS